MSTKWIRVAQLCLGAFALSSELGGVAQAQLQPEVQTGSRIPVKPTKLDPLKAGTVKKAFARCLYIGNLAKISAFLANSDPLTTDFEAAKMRRDRLAKQFNMDACLGEQVEATQVALGMELSPQLLKSMFQEEAYLAKFAVAPALPVGSTEELTRKYVSSPDQLQSAKRLAAFSDCLVFRNLAGADALLRTMPNSAKEFTAAHALAPILGVCLVEGQTLALKPVNIRIMVADGLWTRFVKTAFPTTALAK